MSYRQYGPGGKVLNAADIRRNDALATARLQRSQLVLAQTASQIRLQQRISAR